MKGTEGGKRFFDVIANERKLFARVDFLVLKFMCICECVCGHSVHTILYDTVYDVVIN